MEYQITYFIYLIVSIVLTIFVGNHLHRHGLAWVLHLIPDAQLAEKINDLLLLLYRLFNIGYVVFTLMAAKAPTDISTSISFLATRLGSIALILAYLHYQNIFGLYIYSHFKFSHHD